MTQILKDQTTNIADYAEAKAAGAAVNSSGGERYVLPSGVPDGATVGLFITADAGVTSMPLLDGAGAPITVSGIAMQLLGAPLPTGIELFATVTGAGGSTNFSLAIR